MDHDENLKSNVVNEHQARTEVNGYGVTTRLEEKDGKKILTFTIEKSDLLSREEGFTEQEIRFFENGLKKSVTFFDPDRKPTTDRFNNRYNNNPPPRYNNHNNGNTYNNRRYSSSNPHPNYKNRYGNWDDDVN